MQRTAAAAVSAVGGRVFAVELQSLPEFFSKYGVKEGERNAELLVIFFPLNARAARGGGWVCWVGASQEPKRQRLFSGRGRRCVGRSNSLLLFLLLVVRRSRKTSLFGVKDFSA